MFYTQLAYHDPELAHSGIIRFVFFAFFTMMPASSTVFSVVNSLR